MRMLRWLPALTLILATFFSPFAAQAQTPGQNVNMVSGTKWPGGDPFLQRQNEPSLAVSTRNPVHLLAGANDYRSVDIPNPNSPDERGDAWLGVFKSFDGGATWGSTLLPGYPQDQSAAGLASPLHGFSTAADPIVRAGTNGLFYYSGIAFNRGTNQGQIFVARFMDLNNQEGGDASQSLDPIRYINTMTVDTGTSGQFLDKPWLAVDIPRGTATCTIQVPQGGSTVAQTIPAGNVYVVWSRFTGSTSTKIMFSESQDCGATWSTPTKLSESNSINQGTTMAIDPKTGSISVAWRRFVTSSQPEVIVGLVTTNFGKTLSKSGDMVDLPTFNSATPNATSYFDEETSPSQIRTHAFPTLGVDGNGTVYLAWSQRGLATGGDARIAMATSTDGVNWSKPFAIDNGPLMENGQPVLDTSGNQLARGHQAMPQITMAGGKLFVLYYDLRQDHTTGLFLPNSPFASDAKGNFYQENRQPKGELPASPAQVFTPVLTDANLTLQRHTIDVVVAQATAPSLVFSTARVSRYNFGLRNDSGDIPGFLQQLQVDPPNLPLFEQGKVPFLGDYVDIAGQAMVPTDATGNNWRFNTLPSDSPVVYATWTSNQDVRPPADGNWQNYTPVGGGGPSVTGSGNAPACVVGQEGMRNQNIYGSRITQGLQVSVPQNAKPLSTTLQRTFIVLVQNFGSFDKTFRLTIAKQPPAGRASFIAVPNQPIPNPLPALTPADTTFDVAIAAHTGISRPVFVLSSNPTASITINATEINVIGGTAVAGGLAAFALVNPDPSAPPLINPNGNPAGNISSLEVYDTNISNTNISNTNISNTNISNTNISNTNISNTNISNTNISNASITDATYTITNVGNTTGSYAVKLAGNAPTNTNLQLIVTKAYQTPTNLSCQLALETQNVPVTNVAAPPVESATTTNFTDPTLTDPTVNNATVNLAPGESALVTVRGATDVVTMQGIRTTLVPVVTAHEADTNSNTPRFVMPLLITLGTLPGGTVGAPYNATLQASGGVAPYSWAIPLGALPAWLTLNTATGTVTGTPIAAGTFTFTAQVADSSSPQVLITRVLTITIGKGNTTTAITSVAPSPSVIGQAVVVSFSVSLSAPSVSGAPTGTVSVTDGAGANCTAVLPATNCSLTPLAIGAGVLTATYSGDSNFNGSSGSGADKVRALTTVTIISISPNAVVVGQPTTVTFNVAVVAPGSGTPTGTVTVSDGAGASCVATLPATSCALTSIAIGSYTLTATYSGDNNFAGGSGTSAVQETVSYAFLGFLSPLATAGTIAAPTFSGTVNQGQAVPLKWELLGSAGNVISNLSSVTSIVACPSSGPTAPPGAPCVLLYSPTAGAKGNSSFRFSSPQFIFNWDTSSTIGVVAGFFTVEVQLNDGSPAKATTIQFK